MAKTAAELTKGELRLYQRAACQQTRRKHQEITERQAHAWALARRAAELLRKQFGAQKIVVFGSLVHEGCFTRWSDVDIAAWGLRPQDTFRALGAVQDLASDIELNLVDVSACSPSLLAIIEVEGVEL
jgi:predicted nucleotidyltransferase